MGEAAFRRGRIALSKGEAIPQRPEPTPCRPVHMRCDISPNKAWPSASVTADGGAYLDLSDRCTADLVKERMAMRDPFTLSVMV